MGPGALREAGGSVEQLTNADRAENVDVVYCSIL